MVGHEPKWSSLASSMIGGGDVVFKTATMARIDYDVESWKVISPGRGELKWLHQPSFFTKGEFNL